MNTTVSFELAKLLKEKGFNIDKKYQNYYIEKNYYDKNGDLNECEEQSGSLSLFEGKFSAPTIAEVVMWLCEKHLLWVYAHKDGGWWFPVIENYYDEDEQGTIIESLERIPKIQFNSPTEAYEAAIEYTLTNLI